MAIITVLAAIAIPTFGKQLETARETSDAEAIRALATDAFSAAYTQYVTEGSKATPTTAWQTQVVGPVTPTQKSAGFEYITPTIKIGSGPVTILSFSSGKAGTAYTAAPIYFQFSFSEETNVQDGIKLTAIKYAASADAESWVDASVAVTE